MDTASLSRLESIARNLPIWPGTLHMGMVETPRAMVYIALGRGTGANYPPVAWHGIYAFDYGHQKGIGRLAEVSGRLTLREAQRELLADACWMLEAFGEHGLLDPSYKLQGN